MIGRNESRDGFDDEGAGVGLLESVLEDFERSAM